MTRKPCETGYICRDPRDGSGCGKWVARGPTDAWWFPCECGGMFHPALKSEVDVQMVMFP